VIVLHEDTVTCSACRRDFVVEYVVDSEGGARAVIVNCPHCDGQQTKKLSRAASTFFARKPGDDTTSV
jgi:hypothetical protein